MNSNPKLSYAIAAILSGSPAAISYAATAADAGDEGIAEITVTAQRRSESIQDVPITIQAITGDQLKSLNVSTFDDLLKYTPNVTFSGNGPGYRQYFHARLEFRRLGQPIAIHDRTVPERGAVSR